MSADCWVRVCTTMSHTREIKNVRLLCKGCNFKREYFYAQLELSDKCHTIKGLVIRLVLPYIIPRMFKQKFDIVPLIGYTKLLDLTFQCKRENSISSLALLGYISEGLRLIRAE